MQLAGEGDLELLHAVKGLVILIFVSRGKIEDMSSEKGMVQCVREKARGELKNDHVL